MDMARPFEQIRLSLTAFVATILLTSVTSIHVYFSYFTTIAVYRLAYLSHLPPHQQKQRPLADKMSRYRTTAMDGFEQVKKRAQQYRCTVCAGTFIMDHDGMMRHAKEAEHKSKVKKKDEGWNWEGGWGQVGQGWGGQRDADEVARWMPSVEEMERDQAERDKRDEIVKWIEAVEAAMTV